MRIQLQMNNLRTITNLIKGDDVRWRQHIDKSITNIAFILQKPGKSSIRGNMSQRNDSLCEEETYLEINWQVEEIIGTLVILVNSSQEHF